MAAVCKSKGLQIPSQGLCYAAFALMCKDGRVTARDLQMVLADLRGSDVSVLQLLLPWSLCPLAKNNIAVEAKMPGAGKCQLCLMRWLGAWTWRSDSSESQARRLWNCSACFGRLSKEKQEISSFRRTGVTRSVS